MLYLGYYSSAIINKINFGFAAMIRTLFYIALTIIGLLILMWLFQRQLMYFPNREKPALKDYQASDMQEVLLKTKDGLNLTAWYKAAATQKITIVYFHGNGGHMAGRMPLVRQILNQGYGVLLVSYRGYGGNPGSPTVKGLYLDGQAALDFANKHSKCIVILGESLGTGVATKMALDFSIAGLILQSPYTSMTDAAHYHYPFILIAPKDKYPNIDRINQISVPLLVLHGKQDKVVPFQQGQTIFNASQAKNKTLITIEDRGHNNLWGAKYLNALLMFLEKIQSTCPPPKT